MTRPLPTVRFAIALLAITLLGAAPAPATAQNLASGDIIVPGNRVVDGFGSVNGCFYRLRGGVVTRLFQSALFRGPRDMIIDPQGRLVFFALPSGGNSNDIGLFRIDPATETLERLYRFPYIVQPNDTLPNGASMVTGFPYGSQGQSLHLEKSFEITIDDDANGGWPQVQTSTDFGFSMMTSTAAGQPGMTFRYRPYERICEVGISTSLLPTTSAPFMASDDDFIYYGSSKTIGRTGVPAKLDLHLDGDWGQIDFSGSMPPKNVLIITGNTFDNTRDPNGTVDCGSGPDTDVPFNAPGGAAFAALSMNSLGMLGGGLYISANSTGTGTPYVFNIAPRASYLNPYTCTWLTATKGTGLLGFWLPDNTPTYADRTSPDGDGLLATRNGVLMRTDPGGAFQVLDSSVPYTGRPWRWTGPSTSAVAGASGAPADSGSQVLVVRVDTLAYVMLTDALGRRIGHDVAGNPVNDFGEQGQVLALGAGGTWPRLIVLRDPPNEALNAQVTATGAGEWTVKGYLAHEAGGNLLATTSGIASGAGSVNRYVYVGQPTVLNWSESPLDVESPHGKDAIGFVSIGPVPARGAVRLAYRVPGNGAHVRLDIFDVAGRKVSTAVDGAVSGGVHTLAWSGNGSSGARLANGIYLATLHVNGRRETRRIVLTR